MAGEESKALSETLAQRSEQTSKESAEHRSKRRRVEGSGEGSPPQHDRCALRAVLRSLGHQREFRGLNQRESAAAGGMDAWTDCSRGEIEGIVDQSQNTQQNCIKK